MVEFEFGYISGNKIYRKGFLSVPDREIGEVRGTEDETISFFQTRFNQAEHKVQEIENQIASSVNKGSFLVKLIHFRKSLYEFDGLGDFQQLIKRLNALEDYLNELIRQNRNKNLEIKRSLLNELNLIKDHHNLKEASQKVKDIRDQWIRTGLVPEDSRGEIESAFNEHLDCFYNRKKSFIDDREKMIADYVSRYRNIIEKAKHLPMGSSSRLHDQITALKTEWKQLPKVPVNIITPLWKEFAEAINIDPDQFKNVKAPETDINQIVTEKGKIIKKLQDISVNFKMGNTELESLRNTWKKLPGVINKKTRFLDKTAMELFNKLSELDFIMKIASRRKVNFELLDGDQQIGLLIGILKEMIERDKKDFEMANNNAGIIHSSNEMIQKILRMQIENKIKRITVKTDLLNDLSAGKILIFNGKI